MGAVEGLKHSFEASQRASAYSRARSSGSWLETDDCSSLSIPTFHTKTVVAVHRREPPALRPLGSHSEAEETSSTANEDLHPVIDPGSAQFISSWAHHVDTARSATDEKGPVEEALSSHSDQLDFALRCAEGDLLCRPPQNALRRRRRRRMLASGLAVATFAIVVAIITVVLGTEKNKTSSRGPAQTTSVAPSSIIVTVTSSDTPPLVIIAGQITTTVPAEQSTSALSVIRESLVASQGDHPFVVSTPLAPPTAPDAGRRRSH